MNTAPTSATTARSGDRGRLLLVAAAVLASVGLALLLGLGSSDPASEPSSATSGKPASDDVDDAQGGVDSGTSPSDEQLGSSVPLDLEDEQLVEQLEQKWRPVAEGFARDHATPGADWHERVSRWTAEDLDEALSYTSPINVRAATLSSVDANQVGDIQVTATATYTNGEQMRMLLTVPGGDDGNYYVTRFLIIEPTP